MWYSMSVTRVFTVDFCFKLSVSQGQCFLAWSYLSLIQNYIIISYTCTLLFLPTVPSSTGSVSHTVIPNMTMSAICWVLFACPWLCHLKFCHLCLCSLLVIQQLNRQECQFCAQSYFNLILKAPAICNEHQLKLWSNLSADALRWHPLPLSFIKAICFGPVFFGIIYSTCVCAR